MNSTIIADPTTLERSTGFTEQPKEIVSKRNDRLELINDLEPGPYLHNPPFDDPKFDRLEPNSGIYLRSVYISILSL